MNLVPILSVIIIISFSLLMTKIASAMLVNTGLSRHTAKFQSRSAFTGVGFTTSESEQITTHPARRKIISNLMLLGNAGIVTVMASLLLTFVHKDEKELAWYYGLIVLVGSIVLLSILASSSRVDMALTRVINNVLSKFKNFQVRDYGSLYKLADGYHIIDLYVRDNDYFAGKKVSDSDLSAGGILLLGIEKPNGSYIGTPESDTIIQPNDLLILYGKEITIKELENRKKQT